MRNTKNRLGCLSGTGLVAAIITSLVIAGYVYAKGGLLYNPGPLNAQGGEMIGGVTSHAEIGGECKACHAAPWESATMGDRCTDCHNELTSQIQDVSSMHGKMMHDNPGLSCRDCHLEHRGPDALLTVMTDAEFPHEVTGYSLDGHQATISNEAFVCSDCHGDNVSKFDPQICDTCHRQMDTTFMESHTSSYGSVCLDCHDGVDSLVSGFDHNEFSFKLIGEHRELSCMQCHNGASKLMDFQSIAQDCYSCHRLDDPHAGQYGIDCAVCHEPDGWKPAKFDHNLSDFKLQGKHTDAACEDCHRNSIFKGTSSDCYSCHQEADEHDGRFGTDCAACHNPSAWENVDFDHNESNFPLTGRHVDTPCEQCHTTGQFTGLSTACVSCHADPVFHARMFGADCATCHTTNNWYAPYNGRHPGIADEGGRGVNHGGASCRDCHTQTLHTATCTVCHNGNNFEGGGRGGDD